MIRNASFTSLKSCFGPPTVRCLVMVDGVDLHLHQAEQTYRTPLHVDLCQLKCRLHHNLIMLSSSVIDTMTHHCNNVTHNIRLHTELDAKAVSQPCTPCIIIPSNSNHDTYTVDSGMIIVYMYNYATTWLVTHTSYTSYCYICC